MTQQRIQEHVDQLQKKLQDKVNEECAYADKNGSSRFSTCDHSNWDQDIWRHHSAIIEAIRCRGYSVSVTYKWGVTDITTTKKITLS